MGVKFANMSVFCGTLLTDSDFKAGIEKLTEAKEAVSKLRLEAAKKSKLLQEKQEEANRALKAISEGMTVLCTYFMSISAFILFQLSIAPEIKV